MKRFTSLIGVWHVLALKPPKKYLGRLKIKYRNKKLQEEIDWHRILTRDVEKIKITKV